MKRLVCLCFVAVLAFTAISLGLRNVRHSVTLAETSSAVRVKIDAEKELREKLAAAEQHSREVDKKNAELIDAIKDAPKPKAKRLRAAEIYPRLTATTKMVNEKRFSAALIELKTLYDETAGDNFHGELIRTGAILPMLGRLAREYPEARVLLLQMRDAAHQSIDLHGSLEDAREPALSLIGASCALGDDPFLLTWFDSLPPASPLRRLTAQYAIDVLVSAQRYADILTAVAPAQMNMRFDSSLRTNVANEANNPAARESNRNRIVNRTALDIETLIGGNRIPEAQALTRRVLAYDNTPATLAALRVRLGRVGQPDFVDRLPPAL